VPLTVGYKASAEQFAPRDLVEYAVMAEQLGMDSVVISDHFLPWRQTDGHATFALAWMAAVGERTARVLIGTSVLTPTFRYNPAVIAQAFATMAVLYDNRILLGVGTGEALNEIAVSGIEWPDYRERADRLREAVAMMRALWTEKSVDFDGQYFRLVGAQIFDRPDTPVPIYIAAGGPVTARLAGEIGDGMICTSGKGFDLYQDKLLPNLSTGATRAGRDSSAINRMLEIKVSYDRDPEIALESTRFWAPLSLTAEQKHSIGSVNEMERLADALPISQVAKRWIVGSDPVTVATEIGVYLKMGFNHIVVHGPGQDQERFLTQFCEDILPMLRAYGSGCEATPTIDSTTSRFRGCHGG
jgi:coenzyme F420-dependent glucose-6-phosphate dehydrogenase